MPADHIPSARAHDTVYVAASVLVYPAFPSSAAQVHMDGSTKQRDSLFLGSRQSDILYANLPAQRNPFLLQEAHTGPRHKYIYNTFMLSASTTRLAKEWHVRRRYTNCPGLGS